MVSAIINLFFPKTCHACETILSDNENDFCVDCRHEFPLTKYHFERPETVKKIFFGRVELEAATALFYFHKSGRVQQMLHQLKYKGREQIGRVLGDWLGFELLESPYFDSIDVVIPVPIHSKKLKQRGYNQVANFAQQLAKALGVIYVDDVLLKSVNIKTQVFQSREARFKSVIDSFYAKNLEKIDTKHIC